MRVVIIPGFNIKDGGKSTVGRLVPFIIEEGWEVDEDEAVYGYWSLWKIVFFNGKARADVLRRIAGAIEKADVVVGHSNGANFGMQALDTLPAESKESKVAIWISGAMDSNTPIPPAVKKMLVLYTPWDIWVRLASYVPFNKWGRVGARGYTGDDVRAISIKMGQVRRHSNWFNDTFLWRTWRAIRDFAREYV